MFPLGSWTPATVAKDHPTTRRCSTAPADAWRDHENLRREALRTYNTLLLDARGRLLAAVERVERERSEIGAAHAGELIGKIRELLEYLSEARL